MLLLFMILLIMLQLIMLIMFTDFTVPDDYTSFTKGVHIGNTKLSLVEL